MIHCPQIRGPRDLPELRRWLMRTCRAGGPLDRMVPDANWIRRVLPTAELWWVEVETCALLADSAPTLPDDYVLDMTEVPTAAGLAVFAHDLIGIDSNPSKESDGYVRISAMLWGPVWVPLGQPGEPMVDALGMGTFTRLDLDAGMNPADMQRGLYAMTALAYDLGSPEAVASQTMHGDLFAYLGRSDWVPGMTPDEVAPGDPYAQSETAQRSKSEDRRLMAGLWSLTKTNFVRTETAVLSRPERRRAQREGFSPAIRVLRLGGERAQRPAETTEHQTVDWQHSWVVRPHWRWQAHGPKHSLRRLQLIPAYRKGPEDKPLIGADRVWRVVPPKQRREES